MVKLASERGTVTKVIDSTWRILSALIMAFILFFLTLFGLKKESNKYSKDELKYLISSNNPFPPKKKKDDDDEDQNGSKPKIIRGLAGNAECQK